jgi:hypothetical protein
VYYCPRANERREFKDKIFFHGMAVALYNFQKEEMTMKALAAKLVDLTQTNAETIARQWAKDVKTNEKTYTYHEASEEKILREAKYFYNNFQMMFFNESPYEQAKEIFEKYAEERYREGIPLHETLYALILMRRHMWLYAEFQSLFNVEVEHRHAVESLSRTILMFDYIMYVVTRQFWKLMKLELQAKENMR